MADYPIGESEQDVGLTKSYSGTVGTTSIAIPNISGDPIILALIRCPDQTPNTVRLLYSWDNLTFHSLSPGEYIGWPLKGNKLQIFIKGNVSSVNYEVTLNTEPT